MTPQELKNSILQLAIQGKLVAQRPEEGTGTELFQQIQEEKKRLIKEGVIKKGKKMPEIAEEEVPFEVPENWKWVKWGELSESIQYGYNAPAQQTGRIRMVRISDIQDGKVLWDTVPFCDIEENEIPKYILQKNDILFARTGGTVGKSYIVKDVPYESIYAGYLIRTRYSFVLCPEYMIHFMESQLYWTQLRNGTIATAQPNCNGKTLSKMILPLPPFAEQKRIVAKIEELQPLIDRYEKAWTKLEDFNQRFPTDMQKSLLQLAIQGKLVAQRPEEGTGSELYQQIQEEKKRLVKEGTIKKGKTLPEITEEEVPFDIPESWKWVRLNTITTKISDGTHHSPPNAETGEYKYITAKNIKDSGVSITNITYVSKDIHDEIFTRCNPEYGDILLIKDGATTGTVTVNNLHEPFSLLSSVALLKSSANICVWYIVYTLRSDLFYKNIRSQMKGTGITRITLRQIEPLLIPLPPLAEQRRIVAKLDQLLPLCEKLK